MRAAERPTSLLDFQRSRAQRKAVEPKPKARKPRAPAKPKALTAAQHRKLRGVSPALRIINGGKA
jgi:hypothetical protein